VLHKLYRRGDIISKIFAVSQPDIENIETKCFHIPFLKNLQQKSPMHLAKRINDTKSINTMLSYLSGYGLDHHSRSIVELMPFFLRKQLPAL
jgi:hypothetical protein